MPSRPLTLLPGLALLLAVLLAGCGGDEPVATDPGSDDGSSSESAEDVKTVECDYPESGFPAAKEVDAPPTDAPAEGQVSMTMSTSVGDLVLSLDAAGAPCTVNSFVSLAEQGFFDGTTCHRLTTKGIFVLQCGDPTATGTGGPGYSFPDELSGDETYPAGTLAMANSGPDTNGSQFFIVYRDTELPPLYTVFGSIDKSSVAVVQKVARAGSDNANGPGDGAPRTEVAIEDVSVE